MQKTYDGRWSLDQLKRTIEADEQAEFLTLSSIAKGEATQNVATFDNVAADADAAPALKLQVEDAPVGATLLFEAVLFVEGNEQRVAGYR